MGGWAARLGLGWGRRLFFFHVGFFVFFLLGFKVVEVTLLDLILEVLPWRLLSSWLGGAGWCG